MGRWRILLRRLLYELTDLGALVRIAIVGAAVAIGLALLGVDAVTERS